MLVREDVFDDMAAAVPPATYAFITRDIFTQDFLQGVWLNWTDTDAHYEGICNEMFLKNYVHDLFALYTES